MCIPLTPVLNLLYIVIIEVYLQCYTESVILREIGKPSSHSEISSPNSLYLKAVTLREIGKPSSHSEISSPNSLYRVCLNI